MRFFLILSFLLVGCNPKQAVRDPLSFKIVGIQEPLARVNIVDCNGLSETITLADRLKELSKRNFLDPQPFRKVMRIFAKDRSGITRSIITSYYNSGHIQQYLECVNGRANGLYLEWHQNGQKKIQSHVCAGVADLDEKAFSSWSFDVPCFSWDDRGTQNACFLYSHGRLHGPATTFYPSGEKQRELFYENGLQEQKETCFYKNGAPQEALSFSNDLRHGECIGFNEDGSFSWKETYEKGSLSEGVYWGREKTPLSSVSAGVGVRSLFEEGRLVEQQEIKKGVPEGWITLFSDDGSIGAKYETREGKKDGKELRFFPGTALPRLSLEWKEGVLHGTVKTWYENGQRESQRELSQNVKQGLAMAWYSDGSLMLAEEYDKDKIVRGQYLKKGEFLPSSVIEKGFGTATLFDDTGAVIEKIVYEEGSPSAPD